MDLEVNKSGTSFATTVREIWLLTTGDLNVEIGSLYRKVLYWPQLMIGDRKTVTSQCQARVEFVLIK